MPYCKRREIFGEAPGTTSTGDAVINEGTQYAYWASHNASNYRIKNYDDNGIVLASSPKHPIISETLKRIQKMYDPGTLERESPSLSLFRVIADSLLKDRKICGLPKRSVFSSEGVWLVPDGDYNPLWTS